jgi:hypothetical protein
LGGGWGKSEEISGGGFSGTHVIYVVVRLV